MTEKFDTKHDAENFAKDNSNVIDMNLNVHDDATLFVIQDNRTKEYYVDSNDLIRNFETLISTWTNGKRVKT